MSVMQHQTRGRTTDSDMYRVGVYGWRKRCLYVLILLLTVVIVINLALAIWIMTVLKIRVGGLSVLSIKEDGIAVRGQAEFYNPVYLKDIKTPQETPLHIESDDAIIITARTDDNIPAAELMLSGTKAVAKCDRFEVFGSDERLLFSTDRNEVSVRVDHIRVLGKGGISFDGAVQTGLVQPETDIPLKLESPTKSVEINAGDDIILSSSAGEMVAKSLLGFRFESSQERISFTARDFYIKSLAYSNSGSGSMQNQLCMCKSGRLYLAKGDVNCRASRRICGQ